VNRSRIMLLGLAAGLCVGCRNQTREAGPAELRPEAVRVAAAQLKRLQPTLETFGTIVYQNKADIYPGSEGMLEEVLVQEGTSVGRGQALAVLSSSPLEASRERAESEVASKTALLSLAEERLREGRLAVEARLLAVRKAEAELAVRQAECDNLALVYSNKKQLFEAGGVAEGELEGVRTRFLSAEQALTQARSDLEIQRLGFRDEDLRGAGVEPPADPAQRRSALLVINTRMLAAEREVAVAELAAAQSELRRVQRLLAETTIRSPIDGIVAARLLDPGEKVTPETLLFTVFNTSAVYAQAEVGERELPALEKNQLAAVLVGEAEAPALELSGRVELISPYVHPQTRTARVRIRLDNLNRRLVPGIFVRLRIHTGEPAARIVVPRTAVRTGPEESSEVFVLRGENVFRQAVHLQANEGDLAVIRSGLAEGELVVLNPPTSLRDGSAVEVLR
jgi:multidrug efflux pump subunit AcrA (membrane-fusion protein)